MWVRSQDKKHLIKCDYLTIINSNIYAYINGSLDKIAEYSTQEKALKVLNKITEIINIGYGDLVYQMPQDSEV